jgi:dTDP-4-amino-4,6-dideoxygalactose transaminase
MIPLLKPTIDAQTKQDVLDVFDSGWWGQGPKTKELEEKFAQYVGAKYAVGVNSGTAALDMCLKVYGITGGELITTPMTFVSDAIVGEWNGMDVTFADIDPETLCIDPAAVKITPKTKAIIAVDSHGRLADIEGLRAKFDGLIIEDAAHAMYTPGAGRGDITIWSFQAVKTLAMGDGGMITTNDEQIYTKLKDMSWLGIEKSTYSRAGKRKYSWDYDITHGGLKTYMNDLSAVIGLGQLRRLDETLPKMRAIQSLYNEAFRNISQIKLPVYSATVQYYTMQCENRDGLSQYLADQGYATSVHFKPLSEMTYWKKAVKNPLPVTNAVWPKLLTLPVHDALTFKQVEDIINHVTTFYSSNRV